MQHKNTILMAGLGFMLLIVASMFFYQNFYLKQVEQKNAVPVLVAKKDIPSGTPFTTDNIGTMKLNKAVVLDTHIVDFKEVEGKSAQTAIFKNEMVTTNRISKENSGDGKYRLQVVQSNNLRDIEAGDSIRVFVKPEFMSQLFEIINAKDIDKVYTKISNSGKDSGVISGLSVLASDEEIERYERASSAGKIIVFRYEDLSEMDRADILPYEDAAVLIEKTIEQAKENSASKKYYGRIHKVQEGDTWNSLAAEYKVSVEKLHQLNGEVEAIQAGILLRVN